MKQKQPGKGELLAALMWIGILVIFVPKVKGINLPNYTFGVKEGDTNTYRVKIAKELQKDGTMQNDMGHVLVYPAVTLHPGDTILANITRIINGTLTYQLTHIPKKGQNSTSHHIDYNKPSDITYPLFFHFISTTNTTLIEELAETRYRGGLDVNVTEELITLKYAYDHYLYDSVYNRTTGWAITVYHKYWNSTHTHSECLIEDEVHYSDPTPTPVPFHTLLPSLVVLGVVVVKSKSKAKKKEKLR